MRPKIGSPTTRALQPILVFHLLRRYPHRHEPCVTNHSIGNERMNRSVSEDIRSWVLLTPMDEAFVLCFCDHGKPRAVAYTLGEQRTLINCEGANHLSVVMILSATVSSLVGNQNVSSCSANWCRE